jgi:peptidyl-dipeptidase Dcp
MKHQQEAAHETAADNPLLQPWRDPFGVPPFARIRPEHFLPAFALAFAEHRREAQAIANNAAQPSFENTIAALESAGRALNRIHDVFHLLAGAQSNDAILAVEREVAPIEAAHWSAILLDEGLFRRIEALHRRRGELRLTPEQARVLERYHLKFTRAGAALDAPRKARLAEINERLAALGTEFGQHVLADEQDYALVLQHEQDLDGLPDFMRAAARAAAEERGLAGNHVITLARSSVAPFLEFSARRDLREKVFNAWIARGDGGGATDNKAIIAQMLALRAERGQLLGYESFAHYRLADSMAKTPEAVRSLLDQVWTRARRQALADRDALQALVQAEGGNFKLEAWDWRYYAEKLRKQRCDIDAAEIKPYLELEHMIEAAFYTAKRLFGLSFRPLANVSVWHPDVRAWEVRDARERHLGVFFGDYFARPSKHSGAWMTSLRDQEKLAGDVRPLVANVMNFAKTAAGEPVLLSLDDARTLFHEFGHALHALLSDVTYPGFSGTNVLLDWVELPSQLFEHWLQCPEVLRRFALHYRTHEPIPEDLVQRLLAARTFNQGWATVEYIASALLDLELHLARSPDDFHPNTFDVRSFEQRALARIGMPSEIVMRHRLPHFQHVFTGGSYASGYYSYMWSEVLDADAFAAFEESGDIFDEATARKLLDHVYAAGGSHDPAELYVAFRGRLPTPERLLRRRGLTGAITPE